MRIDSEDFFTVDRGGTAGQRDRRQAFSTADFDDDSLPELNFASRYRYSISFLVSIPGKS